MNDNSHKMIDVEVAYALVHEQRIIPVQVPVGTTALEAVRLSHIVDIFAEIDPDTASLGIFSRVLDGKASPPPQDYVLQAHDRVEIYRPLLLDPKQTRLLRAARAKKAKKAAGPRSRSSARPTS